MFVLPARLSFLSRWSKQAPIKLKLDLDMNVVPLEPPVSQFWGRAGDRAGLWEHRVNPEHGCAEVKNDERKHTITEQILFVPHSGGAFFFFCL